MSTTHVSTLISAEQIANRVRELGALVARMAAEQIRRVVNVDVDRLVVQQRYALTYPGE